MELFAGAYDGKKAALAGLDLEMPMTAVYGRKLQDAVEKGEVPLAVVDDAVRRLLRRKVEYAARPDPIAYPPDLVRAPEHIALAREAAEKGIVLLKNDAALPLDPAGLKSVAVVGRLADAPNLGDHGSSRVYPPRWVTVVDGLREALGPARVVHAPGADLARAREAARRADAAVVVVGFDHSDEGEYIPEKPKPEEKGGDREDLALKAADRELVQAVAAENRRTSGARRRGGDHRRRLARAGPGDPHGLLPRRAGRRGDRARADGRGEPERQAAVDGAEGPVTAAAVRQPIAPGGVRLLPRLHARRRRAGRRGTRSATG